MRYSLLLWPHANGRYEEAMRVPLAGELSLILSACGVRASCGPATLHGVHTLEFECDELPDAAVSALSCHSHMFWLCKGTQQGLVPISGAFFCALGEDLPLVLKYKGKTNERFTMMLINLALLGSDFFGQDRILLCDPMCGKGTTLFQALNRGFSACGTDIDKKDAAEAEDYFKKYLQLHRIKHSLSASSQTIKGMPAVQIREFRLESGQSLRYAVADASLLDRIYTKQRPHILVSDLPYGVQHAPGGLMSFEKLLDSVLPACYSALLPGGAAAFSFNSLTLPRQTVLSTMEKAGFTPLRGEIWDNMSHWVEQAVVRDVAVGRKDAGR